MNYLLGEMGIFAPYQVLEHLPRRYDSFYYADRETLHHLPDKGRAVLLGRVVGVPKTLRFAKLSNTTFLFRDQYGDDYKVVAWNRPYLGKMLQADAEFTISASYDAKRHEMNLLSLKKGKIPPEEALVPIYTLPADYPDYAFQKLVQKSFELEKGKIYEHVPAAFRQKYRLPKREEALRNCHFPKSLEDIRQGQRLLKYEEALMFSLKSQIIRKKNKQVIARGKGEIDFAKVDSFIAKLPYSLTNSQKKAIQEALQDMASDTLMYRLLQGDVGTGKTLVAAILLYANYLRGSQGALMAPTESLARQHYENLKKIFEGTKVQIVLLTGKMDALEKKFSAIDLADGTADIAVGTHALFSRPISFSKLGLAIVDEQHKFGVNQRTLLAQKGDHADVLLMSATPIPRTLSMTIYGDLDVSTLTEFPNSRRTVKTVIIRPTAAGVLKSVDASLSGGHRVYVVAPQIEIGESKSSSVKEVYDHYEKLYPGKVALLHGKMNVDEKEAALAAFRTGLCPILVSTSVIEVGIDVPEANLILVYDPSHFALSSLHQLRGRIGRDGSKSLCLLLYEGNDPDDLDKLRVLENSDEGFHIAEEDLRRRGPGELSGVRQSGLPSFAFVNLVNDFRMFECARDDASYMLEHPEQAGFASLIKLAQAESEGAALK